MAKQSMYTKRSNPNYQMQRIHLLKIMSMVLALIGSIASCDLSQFFVPEDIQGTGEITNFVIEASRNPVLTEDLPGIINGNEITVVMDNTLYAQQHALVPTVTVPESFHYTPTGSQVFFADRLYSVLNQDNMIVNQYTVRVQITID
jgi:hypothetical protein